MGETPLRVFKVRKFTGWNGGSEPPDFSVSRGVNGGAPSPVFSARSRLTTRGGIRALEAGRGRPRRAGLLRNASSRTPATPHGTNFPTPPYLSTWGPQA